MPWSSAMPLKDLWDGEHRGLKFGKKKVLLLRHGNSVYAYQDYCPHLGTPLSEGSLKDGVIQCRFHGWTFDAVTGDGINPCAAQLNKIAVQICDDEILIEIEDENRVEEGKS